ncbi:MAG: hypothetical protein KatS3mg057_0175 [Herpetosiphonaceae bacterium]|nr:MAG: hypothetical protein KatS3mg057_0175 [Herpetosiphonaceae bacterium]
MTARAVPLHHSVIVDDEEHEGRVLDAGEALRLIAESIGATVAIRWFRDEPRYILTRQDGQFELALVAGHLYDTRETLSLTVELRYGDLLLASCNCSAGIERVKLGAGTAWLRTPGGLRIILGSGIGGLLEVQD